ncbi:MAG TPA: nuclear transport factor 2 family protein [Thermoanaerobaculia bacterium]|nr:nuclear transport factor 2 family protein [Thermoanaerobaculia bacterium]
MIHFFVAAAIAVAGNNVSAVLQKQTQELVDAIAAGDRSVWENLLDDGAMITTEDGLLQTKREMLESLHPLPAGVSGKIEVTDFRVADHGRVAIANYVLDEHENYHGHALHCQYRVTDTWQQGVNGWRLIASQVLALRADPPSVSLSEAQADEYAGRYALTPEISYEIRRDGEKLEGRRGGGTWEPLLAEAPDVLFVPGEVRYRKVFLRDAAHRITGFADRREAWDLVWKRVQ